MVCEVALSVVIYVVFLRTVPESICLTSFLLFVFLFSGSFVSSLNVVLSAVAILRSLILRSLPWTVKCARRSFSDVVDSACRLESVVPLFGIFVHFDVDILYFFKT